MKINFKKYPYRGIFTEITNEINERENKNYSISSIHSKWRNREPEIVKLVISKMKEKEEIYNMVDQYE